MASHFSKLPKTMQAVTFDKPGSAEALKITEVNLPDPAPHEVLIKVEAAGINRPDILQRKGLYPPPDGASEILGLEVAGTIVKVGKYVKPSRIGSQVMALLSGGGYAQYCTAHDELSLDIPPGLSLIEAAAIPETYFTVWSNLFMRAGIQAGERLLVHGGASGIGTTAISLAKAFDVEVIVTAGSDEKLLLCEKLGAKLAINYKEDDFEKVITEEFGSHAIDIILDMVGAPYLSRNLNLLNTEGRLVYIAFLGGYKGELDLRPIMMKRLNITGSTLRARSVTYKTEIARELTLKVWPLLEKGEIKPIIYTTFSLNDVKQAHESLESGSTFGKIVLKVEH